MNSHQITGDPVAYMNLHNFLCTMWRKLWFNIVVNVRTTSFVTGVLLRLKAY